MGRLLLPLRPALGLLLLVTAAEGASFPPHLRFRSLDTSRVTVHYHQGLEALARQAATLSDEILARHEGRYGVRMPRVHVVLTDVEGLYRDWPDSDDVIQEISPETLAELMPSLDSGMVPKMQACYDAVTGGVPRATVVDGREPHSVLLELFTSAGPGTLIHAS